MVSPRKLPMIAYFWPGLPQLWLRGSWVGLAVAVGFTALVNVLILATCVFGQWIPPEQMLGGYGLVALAWLNGWWQSRRQTPVELSSTEKGDESAGGMSAVGLTNQPSEELYREAQQVYLQGDWVAAEQLLLKLLKLNDRDAEARLMLATLWRRQGRHREANRQLDKLSRLEAAEPWQNEIAVERRENAAALTEIETVSQTSTATQSDDKSSRTKEQEPKDYNIADTDPSATETKETIRRHAA